MDTVAQVAAIALRGALNQDEIAVLIGSMDFRRLRSQLVALGLCDPKPSDLQVAKLYFSKRCSAISPNPFFDEAWYLESNLDVRQAVNSGELLSGFVHYIHRGIFEGRWPNAILAGEADACSSPEPSLNSLNSRIYLKLNPAAQSFLTAFPHLSPLAHYNLYGRLLGFKADYRNKGAPPDDSIRMIAASFDVSFYRRTYLTDEDCDDPLTHYLTIGAKAGHSPNEWFDEAWYRAFYPEVRTAIDDGWLPSGFFHYLHAGRAEGRHPRFVLTLALEARMPGVTNPSLLRKAAELEQRLEPRHGLPRLSTTPDGHSTIWMIFPSLNPDIMFGGYRAALWLVVAMLDAGFAVNVVCLQEDPNLPYFMLRENSEVIRRAFLAARVLDKVEFAGSTFGAADRFLAYSAWDLPLCSRLAARTPHLPLFLVQEYEPVFYDHGSHRAACESLYRLPHFAIINSSILRDYLSCHGYGPFASPDELTRAGRHVVFEHRIMQLPRATAATMAGRSGRTLILYARPEGHAARNVIEIAILALQRLCRSGFFGPEWRFLGLGALSSLPPIELGDGHELVLKEKQSEEDYQRTCGSMDVGISLMYAPHPSVIPFEFATTGALVVTNTYENRTESRLKGICGNIVPCVLSIDGVADAIREAVSRVGDFQAREKRALIPNYSSWLEIFTKDFVESFAGRAASQPVSTLPNRGRKTRAAQPRSEPLRAMAGASS